LPLAFEGRPRTQVQVWRDQVSVCEHEGGSTWFSALLGQPTRLVFMPDSTRRTVRLGDRVLDGVVSFADAYPLLLISQASLDELNRRLARPVTMARFRPNLVVSGCPAHAEDNFQRFAVGPVSFEVVKPCERCSVTTVDPETGIRGTEPLATLATYRRRGKSVCFGVNLLHNGTGLVREGDAVELRT
jgi:uncharacterized protein YcbX